MRDRSFSLLTQVQRRSLERLTTPVIRGRSLILQGEFRPATGELKHHMAEVGNRFVAIDSRNCLWGNLYVACRRVADISQRFEPAKSREHTVDAAMIFLGDGGDLTGLTVEVSVDGVSQVVEAPSAVYLPAHTTHSYALLEGSGTYIKIVIAPRGDYNAVTP